MDYTIENLTDSSRNDNPTSGDFIKITYANGNIEKKHFWEQQQTEVLSEEEEIQNQLINEAKLWRKRELVKTDFIVPLTDFPNHAAWITYRQELRDWPATENFPNIKPTAPAEL